LVYFNHLINTEYFCTTESISCTALFSLTNFLYDP
jgi:hypothetical protein